MSTVDPSPDIDALKWTPDVPRPPKPEVSLAAAVLFSPGYVRARRRSSYGDARAPHETPSDFARRWNSSNREKLLYAMRHGGIRRLNTFDHNLKELPAPWDPSGLYRFIYSKRYLRAQEEFRCSYNRVVWEAGELRTFRDWASSRRRPCAPRLEQWLDQHAAGHPELARFVHALLLIARESDPRIVDAVACAGAARARARRDERLAREEEERKERERRAVAQRECLAKAADVQYVFDEQAWEAERAAEVRLGLAVARLRGRVVALSDAAVDIRSRGEYHQLELVQQQHRRLQAELDQWERIGLPLEGDGRAAGARQVG